MNLAVPQKGIVALCPVLGRVTESSRLALFYIYS